MPLDTILVVIAVSMMFLTFGFVLSWGDRQTRELRSTQQGSKQVAKNG